MVIERERGRERERGGEQGRVRGERERARVLLQAVIPMYVSLCVYDVYVFVFVAICMVTPPCTEDPIVNAAELQRQQEATFCAGA